MALWEEMPRLEFRLISMFCEGRCPAWKSAWLFVFCERERPGWNSAREDAQAGIPLGCLCFVKWNSAWVSMLCEGRCPGWKSAGCVCPARGDAQAGIQLEKTPRLEFRLGLYVLWEGMGRPVCIFCERPWKKPFKTGKLHGLANSRKPFSVHISTPTKVKSCVFTKLYKVLIR